MRNRANGIRPFWILLTVLLFVSCTGNEREVTYRVEGTAEQARLTYTTGAAPEDFSHDVVDLPWEHTIAISPGSRVTINAQNMGTEGTVEAVIEIEGEQVQRHTSSIPHGMALVSSSVEE